MSIFSSADDKRHVLEQAADTLADYLESLKSEGVTVEKRFMRELRDIKKR